MAYISSLLNIKTHSVVFSSQV